MKKLVFLAITTALLSSGCSLLRYQYGDRSKIEQDTASGPAQIVDGNNGAVISSANNETVLAPAAKEKPIITESNMAATPDNTVKPASNGDQTTNNIEITPTALEQSIVSDKPVVQKSAQDVAIIKVSDQMVTESYATIPNGSLVYVEKVACDPPLKYDTKNLSASITAKYASSGKYKMASQASINALRSKLEYQDVTNGDWGSLATLARAQKYDYVFYGAIGEQDSKKYLTYYLIKVSSGEIVWENTKLF